MLGPDHPDTLRARHNLVRWRGEAGDAVGAAAVSEVLLADYLRVLGPDHPNTRRAHEDLTFGVSELRPHLDPGGHL